MLLAVAGLLLIVGPWFEYRTGYTGIAYVDGTDDSATFSGLFQVFLGLIVVVLAVAAAVLSGDNRRAASTCVMVGGLVGLLSLGVLLGDVASANDSNKSFGGQLGVGIWITGTGAVLAVLVGVVALVRRVVSRVRG